MKNLTFSLLFAALFLAGCGSGSGGGSDPIVPTDPNGPPTSYQSYVGTIDSKSGSFASQGNTAIEFHNSELRLVFSTVPYGDLTVYFPPAGTTGYHGSIYINAVKYNIWFWPAQNALSITDINSINGASWNIVQVVGNG